MPVRLHPKLSARYFEPFKVLQQVGNVAFRLELPESVRIHLVVHASQLKKAVGDQIVEKIYQRSCRQRDLLFGHQKFWNADKCNREMR